MLAVGTSSASISSSLSHESSSSDELSAASDESFELSELFASRLHADFVGQSSRHSNNAFYVTLKIICEKKYTILFRFASS